MKGVKRLMTTHKGGKRCVGCKVNRRKLFAGKNKSSQRLSWERAFKFRLYSRNSETPRYWIA